jgi:hypothetical protein
MVEAVSALRSLDHSQTSHPQPLNRAPEWSNAGLQEGCDADPLAGLIWAEAQVGQPLPAERRPGADLRVRRCQAKPVLAVREDVEREGNPMTAQRGGEEQAVLDEYPSVTAGAPVSVSRTSDLRCSPRRLPSICI